jgi:hypothetical protein
VEGGGFSINASAHGAILMTAHMGNYDLGAAVSHSGSSAPFSSPRREADGQTAQHLDESLERAGGGAVRSPTTSNVALPLELLNAIREGEIISIRAIARSRTCRRGQTLRRKRQVAGRSCSPLLLRCRSSAFHCRTSFHRYKIIAREPVFCVRTERPGHLIEEAMHAWSRTLEA